MDKIKVAVLNPTAISEAEKMMVCAARLTQRGHTVKDLSDFLALYDKEYTEKTAKVIFISLLMRQGTSLSGTRLDLLSFKSV